METSISLLCLKNVQLALFQDRGMKFMPSYSISWRSILIFHSHLRLGIHNGSFLQVSKPKSFKHSCFPTICTTCLADLNLCDLITRIIFGEAHNHKTHYAVSHYPLLTYFMEQSPSWEANRFYASQEIPDTRKRSPPLPTLGHLDTVHVPPPKLLKIQLNNIILSSPGYSKRSLSLGFPHHNLSTFLLSPYVLHDQPISFFSVLSPE